MSEKFFLYVRKPFPGIKKNGIRVDAVFLWSVWKLESRLEGLVSDLHDVHALCAGEHLLRAAETARFADLVAEAVEHGDFHALAGRRNYGFLAAGGNRSRVGVLHDNGSCKISRLYKNNEALVKHQS